MSQLEERTGREGKKERRGRKGKRGRKERRGRKGREGKEKGRTSSDPSLLCAVTPVRDVVSRAGADKGAEMVGIGLGDVSGHLRDRKRDRKKKKRVRNWKLETRHRMVHVAR
jgi:hypothetical protein